ncbi:unnamed protein product [Prorocentrum cordatum]|uniref:Hexosyltransferase n=1 Tax=Prorocentrum cordatum TaxID=2364126 RepID=A0ABN9TD86_9DINO|nr:unnamed protein product [Polarella glacialis]
MADGPRPIPVNTPKFWGGEKEFVAECIETGWISSEGPGVRQFEEALAAQCGRKHGVACANGTAALDIAVKALGLGAGDEVIMPTFSAVADLLHHAGGARGLGPCAGRLRRGLQYGRLAGCGQDHAEDEGNHVRPHVPLPLRHGAHPRSGQGEGDPCDRGRGGDDRADVRGPPLRLLRGREHDELLPQQAHHHRGGGHGARERPRSRGEVQAPAEPVFRPREAPLRARRPGLELPHDELAGLLGPRAAAAPASRRGEEEGDRAVVLAAAAGLSWTGPAAGQECQGRGKHILGVRRGGCARGPRRCGGGHEAACGCKSRHEAFFLAHAGAARVPRHGPGARRGLRGAFPVAERIARRGFYILRRPGSQRRGLRGGCAARPVRQRPECAWAEEPGAVRGAAAAAGGRRRPRHRQRARAAPRGLCRQGHQGTGGDGGADGARVDGRDLQSDLLGGLELIDGLPESRQVVMNDGSGARGQRDVVAASRLLIWMRGAVAEGAMNGLAPETEWVVLLGDDVFVNLARLFYFVVQHPAREHPVVFAHCLSDTEAYDFDAPCLDGGAVLLNRLALDAIGEVASCRECPHVVSDQVSLGYCAFFNAVPLVHLPALHCHTPRMGDSDRHLVRDMLAHHWIAAGGLSASALAAEAPAAPWSPFEPGFPSFGCAAPPGRLWTLQQLSERLAFCGAAAGEGGGRQGPGSGRACPPRGGRQIKRGHKLFTKYTTRFKQWSPYYCSTMFGYSSCRGARPT